MESLPSVDKAYSMVLRIEKQREVNHSYPVTQENNAFFVNTQQGTMGRGKIVQGRARGNQNQNNGRGRGRANDKAGKLCDYCGTPGLVRETCFQLNGYSEWYQQLKAQKEGVNFTKSETSRTPFGGFEEAPAKQDNVASVLQGLQQ